MGKAAVPAACLRAWMLVVLVAWPPRHAFLEQLLAGVAPVFPNSYRPHPVPLRRGHLPALRPAHRAQPDADLGPERCSRLRAARLHRHAVSRGAAQQQWCGHSVTGWAGERATKCGQKIADGALLAGAWGVGGTPKLFCLCVCKLWHPIGQPAAALPIGSCSGAAPFLLGTAVALLGTAVASLRALQPPAEHHSQTHHTARRAWKIWTRLARATRFSSFQRRARAASGRPSSSRRCGQPAFCFCFLHSWSFFAASFLSFRWVS